MQTSIIILISIGAFMAAVVIFDYIQRKFEKRKLDKLGLKDFEIDFLKEIAKHYSFTFDSIYMVYMDNNRSERATVKWCEETTLMMGI